MTTLLLVGFEPEQANALADTLQRQGLDVSHRNSAGLFDGVLCSARAFAATEQPQIHFHFKPIIVLSAEPSIHEAVQVMKRGAADYLDRPDDQAALLASLEFTVVAGVSAAVRHQRLAGMLGDSPQMRALFEQIERIGPSTANVLINGESGTGKELVARSLHLNSGRSDRPFLSLNCAAIPERLISVELFGSDDDPVDHAGLLARAAGGTMFLDEIGELPASAQVRLLRVLDRTAAPESSVRMLAASQRDLLQLTQSGQFREDLFYRLNVFNLRVPPLRERGEDILLLARAHLARICDRLGKTGLTLSQQAESDMLAYRWPGNVRELENAVERAVILCDGDRIDTEHLAIETTSSEPSAAPQVSADDQTSLEDYFVQFVLKHQDQLTETELAEKLGISRKSLWERRQRLNIPRRKTRKRGLRRSAS